MSEAGHTVESIVPDRESPGQRNSVDGEIFSRLLLDLLPSHIALLDANGKVVAVNESWRRFASENGGEQQFPKINEGVDYLEVCRKAAQSGDMLAQEASDGIRRVLQRATDRFVLEYPCHAPNQPRWFEMEVLRKEGVEGVLVVHKDVTPQKQAEQILRAKEERLRLANERLKFHMENNPLGVIEFDPELRVRFWSGGAERIFGWESAEVHGKRVWDLAMVPESDASKLDDVARAMVSGKSTRTVMVNRNLRKDGSEIWCQWYNSSLVDASGKLQSIFSLVLDVTELRATDKALRESEGRYRLLFDRNPDGVFAVDMQGRFTAVNPACETISGYGREELLGKHFLELCAPDQVDRTRKQFESGLSAPGYSQMETALIRKDGSRVELWIAGEPMWISGGQPSVYCTARDITERKRSEKELERLVEERTRELQETTDQLNTFVYTLAHDLRAPLRAQVAFATLLLDNFGDVLGEKGRSFAKRIAESAQRQGSLLSDLLHHVSLSRAELPLETVDLRRAVKIAETDMAEEIQRREATFSVCVQGYALANAASLHLVFTNLLSNALKFVKQGVKPRVRVWTEPRVVPDPGGAETERTVRIWVEDNGLGIAPQHIDKLFGLFQRLHAMAEYPGTGIGLAIVKKAAERMGGRVGVESEEGKGSRFWVELKQAGPADHFVI